MIHRSASSMASRVLLPTARCLLPTVFLLLTAFCLLPTALGQSTTATLSGTVGDQNGAVIPGVNITIKNADTGIQRETTTKDDGSFSVPLLPPGKYIVRARRDGFAPVDFPNLVLNVGDQKALQIQLKAGDINATVQVINDVPLINTESAAVSTVVDRNFAENLPMNGRSFQTLIQLTPGVVLTQITGADNGQFSVNGQRAASNYWMVDGVSANFGIGSPSSSGQGAGGALPGFSVQGGTNSLVSVDALQEFRIQTSTYAPEFGRTPGAQISIVTRAGTNQFHGAVFDYLRNDVLDASNWFNGNVPPGQPPVPKAKDRQNDFGGTFSGPILLPSFGEGGRQPGYSGRNRTFFFFSYEGLRLRLPATIQSIVPTVTARNAAIPAMQPIFNAFPLPGANAVDLGNGLARYTTSLSNSSTLDATSLRIDHRVSDKLNLFGRYNYSPSELLSRVGVRPLSSVVDSAITIQTATAGVTWTPSPAITNDLRFNYSRSAASALVKLDNFGGAVPLTTSVLNFPTPFSLQTSRLQVTLSGRTLIVGPTGNSLQQQYNLVESLSVQKGSHSLKFGVDYRRSNPTFDPALYTQVFFFSSVPSADNGQLLFTLISTSRRFNFGLQNLGAFAQDTWRASSRLTVTYGLRWDIDFVPSSNPAFATLTNFNKNNLAAVVLAPSGTAPYSTTYANFAPRIGAAYQLSRSQGWATVLRGGFGVFYDLASQEVGNLFNSTQYPFGAQAPLTFGGNYGSLTPTSPQLQPPPISSTNVSVSGITAFDPKLSTPYTLEWNAALEQMLGRKQTISASYVGSVGRRLLQTGRALSPNANVANVAFVTNAATSDYHALQLQFQRRLSQGLQALASYTWSHSIDEASGGSLSGGNSNFSNTFAPGLDPRQQRGPSDFDIRHVLSAGLTYDLPTPNINDFSKAILKGWSVDNIIQASSAPPVNVIYSQLNDNNSFGDTVTIRPNVVPGQPLYLFGPQFPGGKAFNPNAFAPPPKNANGTFQQGNLGRNALRGFRATQWDLAIHREFSISETLKLQFRAEMFNVLNHPNFASPVSDLSSPASPNPQFGLSTQTLNQSLGAAVGSGAFSALYQIGGPRSIQLGLKILF